MKKCFKCGAIKPLTEYYKHKAMADGYLNKCKNCTKSDTKRNREANLEYYREYDRERHKSDHNRRKANHIASRQWRKENPDRHSELTKLWRKRNPDKYKAQMKLNNALRSGSVQKAACEKCGDINAQAHHYDYGKPLDVIWLCVTHHAEHHASEREKERNRQK